MSQGNKNKGFNSASTTFLGAVVLGLIGLLTAFFANGGIELLKELKPSPSPTLVTSPTPSIETSASPPPMPPTPPSPSPTSPSPTSSEPIPAPSAINLSGTWIGLGYGCGNVQIPSEEIKIEHKGSFLQAVKTQGDDCIRTGEVTFQGIYDGKTTAPIDIQLQISPNGPSNQRQFIPARLEVKSADELTVMYSGYNTLKFTRKVN